MNFVVGSVGLMMLLLIGHDTFPDQTALPYDIYPIKEITAPTEIIAGDVLEISIKGSVDHLLMIGSYGTQIYPRSDAEFIIDATVFQIPSEDTEVAGFTTIIAQNQKYSLTHHLTIRPHDPIEPLTPLVGARSIVANGEDWSMAVVVPFDKYGNAVADGIPFTVRSLHPDGETVEQDGKTDHLLAWWRIPSRTTAGTTRIAVETEGIYSSEAILLEVADWPNEIQISAEKKPLLADGRQLVTVETATLKDRFGNVLPDGTVVDFVINSKEGIRFIQGQTIDGSAEIELQSPLEPQEMTVLASIYPIKSKAIELTYEPNLQPFELTATYDEATKGIRLQATQLVGKLNQFIPDGTTVALSICTELAETVVENGQFEYTVYLTKRVDSVEECEAVATIQGITASTKVTR